MEKSQQDHLIAKVLANRFKVLKLIGRGGMANVYQGLDMQMNTIIALKVLKSEYLSDEEFVKRFDAEARSASSLSHPNIVKVYGVGESEGVRYMVMQYIEGTTLKDMIDSYGRLDYHLALSLIIQVAQALQEAHLAGIVHRDIKPHNIMVTPTQQALVTDFGIARASNTNMITMTGAAALGSVHYFSPEQARGGAVGFKADIYSLGIMFYEMLTGQLPFDGDTSVAVAIMHLQNEAKPPHQINPNIPIGLSNIVMKCMRKNPVERYEDAQALINELISFRANPNGNYGKVISAPEQPRVTAILPHANYLESVNFDKLKNIEKTVAKRKQKRRLELFLMCFLSILFLLGILVSSKYIFSNLKRVETSEEENDSFIIGNYVDRDIKEVVAELDAAGVKYNIIKRESEEEKNDKVLEQNLAANTKYSNVVQRPLILIIGGGMMKLDLPAKIEGMSVEEIQHRIEALGLRYKTVSQDSDTVEENKVIKTEPPVGERVKKTQTVIVYVSSGPSEVLVPDLQGKEREEAKKILEKAGLEWGCVRLIGFFAERGTHVLRTEPAAGTKVKKGTKIEIVMEDKNSVLSSD